MCTNSALVCTSCTLDVQENGARDLVCRDSWINHMFRNTFPTLDI